MSEPNVKAFFDEATNTYSYVVSCPETKACAVLDSVLDYDPSSGSTSTDSADAVIEYVQAEGLACEWVIETHVHADHLSAAPYVKAKLGGKTGIGEHIKTVQSVFGKVFNAGTDFALDGSQFDRLFVDGDRFTIGNLEALVIHTPGHTPACLTYVVGLSAFVGDTLFMPDYGSARCDFPGGDARVLFESVQKIFALPEETKLHMCHDYKAPGRDEYAYLTTVKAEREGNIHLKDGTSIDDFVKMRTERDATLNMPRLILPSVQVNMRAGELPEAEDNGVRYLKMPLNQF